MRPHLFPAILVRQLDEAQLRACRARATSDTPDAEAHWNQLAHDWASLARALVLIILLPFAARLIYDILSMLMTIRFLTSRQDFDAVATTEPSNVLHTASYYVATIAITVPVCAVGVWMLTNISAARACLSTLKPTIDSRMQ